MRRWLELTMAPRAGGGIDFVSRQLRAEPRVPPFPFDRAPVDSATLLRMCSWCKNVQVAPATWDSAEEAVRALGLFEQPVVPEITHGICPGCVERFEFDARR